ncbi:MAG: YitT family protein [Bacteroidales bacterium]|nr:YitT family protein [Bacteroidales bacterium]
MLLKKKITLDKAHQKSIYRIIKSYFLITLGLLMGAIGWTAFIIPAQITGGGITGVSALIFYSTKFPVGLSFLLMNILLVVIAIKILGTGFGIKTIYSVLVLSFFFSIFQQLITEPIIKEGFMSAVIGGGLAGTGMGLIFSQGGSTGGTDIIAMIINKYRNISPGKLILFIDVIIISSSYLIFHSLEKIVYGFVTMGISSYAIDLALSGIKKSVQIFIFSRKYNEIAEQINKKINRGVTVIDGKGWYTKEDQQILMIIARKRESHNILRITKEIDPEAFISLGDVMGVYGKGFEEIRS